MNTTKLLLTSAVVVFAAATCPSMAQENVPQRERTAPAEKIAPPGVHNQGPNGRVGDAPQSHGRTETTGQAPREERQSRPGEHNVGQEPGGAEQPRKEQERTTGQPQREDRTKSPSQNRVERERQQNRVEQEKGGIGRPEGNRETTGQAAAGARSNLNPETRTRIHEFILQERNAPRVNSPNFDVSIGTRVPRTVHFMALPRTVVEIEPAWRGYEYFLVGDQMVIVNPRTMEIVAVVDA